MMGKHKLVWSHVQLRLVNQHKIVSIGHLTGVLVNIDGVHNMEEFEVIEIMDDSQPYPTLMGLELDFDNQVIINLKRRDVIFEVEDFKFTAPLDPLEGKRYIDPTGGNHIENLYNMTERMEDYVNLNAVGVLHCEVLVHVHQILKKV
jgi:hypothetical protein